MINNLRTIIIEDESIAARHLEKLLGDINPNIQVIAKLDSVGATVEYFENLADPGIDLLFMDIDLGDGLCFEILDKISLDFPVVFTTTYDRYAIDVFEFHAIGYLLKPLSLEKLRKTLNRFVVSDFDGASMNAKIENLLSHYSKPNYKERCLVSKGDKTFLIEVKDIMVFYSEGGYIWMIDKEGTSFLANKTMESLELHLNPRDFFRINRKIIVSLSYINYVEDYINYRLKIQMSRPIEFDLIVSRNKTKAFKKWLTGMV